LQLLIDKTIKVLCGILKRSVLKATLDISYMKARGRLHSEADAISYGRLSIDGTKAV